MPKDKLSISVFIDYVCPWCYLCTPAVERLKQHHQVQIKWQPFPLHPSTPPEGMLLSELFGGRDLERTHSRLYAMMDEAGLEHNDRTHIYNTRLAQELGLWAESRLNNDSVHHALLRAYFVDNRNISDLEVLLDIADSCGLDRSAVQEVLQQRSYSSEVDAAWQLASRYNISGVPAFLASNYVVTGCQPYEELERFVSFVQEQNS